MPLRPYLLAATAGWLAPVSLLAQTAGTGSTAPPESPFKDIVVPVVVAILSSLLTLLFVEPIKEFLSRIAAWAASFFGRLGFRFRKRYLEALAEKHRWLKLIGVYNSADLHPPRLQEVYVSLRLAAAAGGAEDDPRFEWHQIFQPAKNRLVILGSPGAGKSTLLDYLVLVLTGQVPHALRGKLGTPFPLFARLRELGTEGAGTLRDLLARSAPLERVPADFPARWLEGGGCVVLLDGLDEVLDDERHARAVEEIGRLVNEYPDNHYVVTCRIAGWHNQLPGFATYEVQPFAEDDVRRFVGVWYREVLRKQEVNKLGPSPAPDRLREVETKALAEASARTAALCQALEGRRDLLSVATTPLLLSLITLVHFHRHTDLPKGRAKLYEQCVEILVDLWDRQDKRLDLPKVPTLKEKRMVLEAIAFHFLIEDRLEADLAILRPVVEPLLSRIEAQVTVEDLIRQIWERSGILQEQRLGWYGFAHRALYDFLAAAYVVAHEKDDLLLDKAGEERWREVILIAAGLAPSGRAERLVGSLLTRSGDSGAELEMAGLTLAEDVQLGADLRAEVRKRLLDRLAQEEVAGPFRRLAGALMATDLGAARDWMANELGGVDTLRTRRILELLPGMGEEHARPLTSLICRLGEEGSALNLRVRAFRTLASLKSPLESEVRQVLEKGRQERAPELKNAAAWAWCELGRPEDLGLVKVPAGEFLMGSAKGKGRENEEPQHRVHLPTFYIGKFPVTVEDFSTHLLASGAKVEDEEAFRAWNRQADHPVVVVSWFEALEYAQWHGMSLPSEAEWEKAARGTGGRQYPWGDEWRAGHANTREHWEGGRRILSWLRLRSGVGTTMVGAFSPQGDSPYGCADMTGNVWEWTRSVFAPYPYEPADGREDTSAPDHALRVLHGGSSIDFFWHARCSYRIRYEPASRYSDVGFRVVLAPFSSDL